MARKRTTLADVQRFFEQVDPDAKIESIVWHNEVAWVAWTRTEPVWDDRPSVVHQIFSGGGSGSGIYDITPRRAREITAEGFVAGGF